MLSHSSEGRSLSLRCQQGLRPLEVTGENLLLVSGSSLVCGVAPTSTYDTPFSLSVAPHTVPFFMRTLLEFNLMLTTSAATLFPNKVIVKGFGVRTSTYEFFKCLFLDYVFIILVEL